MTDLEKLRAYQIRQLEKYDLEYRTESDSEKPEAVGVERWGSGFAGPMAEIQREHNALLRAAMDAPRRKLTWWERHRPSWWPY